MRIFPEHLVYHRNAVFPGTLQGAMAAVPPGGKELPSQSRAGNDVDPMAGQAAPHAMMSAPCLPLELWVMVAACGLQARDLVSMSSTCRAWYHVSHDLARFLSDEARIIDICGANTVRLLNWLREGTPTCWDFHTRLRDVW